MITFEASQTCVPYTSRSWAALFSWSFRLRIGRERLIGEVVEAGQLAETVLAPELVETRDAALAVTNNVERGDIDLLGGAVEPRQA